MSGNIVTSGKSLNPESTVLAVKAPIGSLIYVQSQPSEAHTYHWECKQFANVKETNYLKKLSLCFDAWNMELCRFKLTSSKKDRWHISHDDFST